MEPDYILWQRWWVGFLLNCVASQIVNRIWRYANLVTLLWLPLSLSILLHALSWMPFGRSHLAFVINIGKQIMVYTIIFLITMATTSERWEMSKERPWLYLIISRSLQQSILFSSYTLYLHDIYIWKYYFYEVLCKLCGSEMTFQYGVHL